MAMLQDFNLRRADIEPVDGGMVARYGNLTPFPRQSELMG